MLRTKVKAAHILHLTDARYFAAQYVDWVGFPLGSINAKEAKSIMDWLAGVQFVGEFADGQQSAQEILQISQELQLDAAQLPPFFDKTAAEPLAAAGLPLWKTFYMEDLSADSWAELHYQAAEWEDVCACFVLDLSACAPCESWQAAEWSTLAIFLKQFPTLLQPNLQKAETLSTLLEKCPKLQGLNFLGGAEERIGVKSFDQLDEWFEQLYTEQN